MLVNPAAAELRAKDVVWCLAESEPHVAAALAAETAADGSDWREGYEDQRRAAHLDDEEERVAMVRAEYSADVASGRKPIKSNRIPHCVGALVTLQALSLSELCHSPA